MITEIMFPNFMSVNIDGTNKYAPTTLHSVPSIIFRFVICFEFIVATEHGLILGTVSQMFRFVQTFLFQKILQWLLFGHF